MLKGPNMGREASLVGVRSLRLASPFDLPAIHAERSLAGSADAEITPIMITSIGNKTFIVFMVFRVIGLVYPDMTYPLTASKYNPEDCFTFCKGYPYMTINIAVSTDQYNCKCGQTNRGTDTQLCNENDQYYYDPTTPVSTGGLARRSAWRLESRNANLKSCPAGMDACVVPGSKGAYEVSESEGLAG
jgi:hypothetical protein